MKTRRTYLGMVGVVSLALGANAAATTFDLDATLKKTTYYAKETLTGTQKGTDGVTYYEVHSIGDDKKGFLVQGKVGIGGPVKTVMRIRYDFTNMVLSNDEPKLKVYAVKVTDGVAKRETTYVDGVIRSGGGAGASFVTFIVTREEKKGIESRTSEAELTIRDTTSNDDDGTIAVSPDAPVSIKMTVTDDLGGTADEYTSSYPAAIRVGEALVVKPDPKNATASVVEDFMRFKPQTLSGTLPVLKVDLGKLTIKKDVAELSTVGNRAVDFNAANGRPAVLSDLIAMGDEATSTKAATGSFATVQGDFSFVSKVTFGSGTECPVTADDMLIRDTAGKVTNTMALKSFPISWNAKDASPTLISQTLCIHVDGETVIPRGGTPYSVALDFEPGTASAKFPPADRSLNLGRIRHDGTAVRFPYLTIYPGYNQRIVIVNEGEEVRYNFDFTSEADVSATALGVAAGMLPARQTTVLRVADIVEVMGGSRTAGTLTIVADPATVEVAVTQVNLETRGTDTLYVDAEPNLE